MKVEYYHDNQIHIETNNGKTTYTSFVCNDEDHEDIIHKACDTMQEAETFIDEHYDY